MSDENGWNEVTLKLRYHDEAFTPGGISRCEPTNLHEMIDEINREMGNTEFGGTLKFTVTKGIDAALDAYHDALKTVAQHFGKIGIFYDMTDMREYFWRHSEYDGEVFWWGDDIPKEKIDPADPEFSSQIIRAQEWSSETHTMFYADDCCGNQEALVFDNTRRVPFEEDS